MGTGYQPDAGRLSRQRPGSLHGTASRDEPVVRRRLPRLRYAAAVVRGFASRGVNWPSVEISDTEKELRITAEVPGLEEKDIEVLLDDGVLTLKGEKRSETEDKDRQFSERVYGRFERRIPLGYEVEQDKVDAHFRNGVLTVILPKTAKAQSQAKRIAIKG